MFSIDGIEYRVECSIERRAEIKTSDISGMTMDGHIFNDVLGTYYSYDVRLSMPLRNKGRYGALIDQLTEPVEGHAFILPYNESTLQLTGLVVKPEDVWVRLPSGYEYWDGLRFTINANGPTREMSLGEVISRGVLPMPNAITPDIGDTYQWTADGWEEVSGLPDLDLVAF